MSAREITEAEKNFLLSRVVRAIYPKESGSIKVCLTPLVLGEPDLVLEM